MASGLLINEDSQVSIDSKIEWIIERFGEGYLSLKRLVIPDDFFYDGYINNDSQFRKMINRTCMIMDIDKSSIIIQIISNNPNQAVLSKMVHQGVPWNGYAGLYQEDDGRVIIFIEEMILKDPIVSVAILVHELCHYKLLYQLDSDADDEVLTDILTVFFNFWIFNSNSAVTYKQYDGLGKQGWSISKTGYLSEYEFGYVIAKWITLQQIDIDTLKKLLKPNVYDSLKRTLIITGNWKHTSILEKLINNDKWSIKK